MSIKENIRRVIGLIAEPKTLASLQLVVATVTLVHAVKRLRETFASSDDE